MSVPKNSIHILSNKDIINKTAICAKDGSVKLVKYIAYKGRTYWRCYEAGRERSKLFKRKKRQIRKNMLLDHCEICNKTSKETRLCWDHDHKTNKFRGTLCASCNMILGRLEDNPILFKRAYEYLIKHK